MRVLLLSNMWPGPRGPFFGVFVERHAARLETRVELRRVVIDDPRKGRGAKLAKYTRFFAAAWRESLRDVDLVHAHYAHPTALGALPALARGIPLVITAHGADVNVSLLERRSRAARLALERADHVIAVSEDLATKLRGALGARCPPISVRNMGVDLERFHPPASPPPPRSAIFVGQLVPRKGPDTIIAALARARTPIALEIVGDGPLRAALEAEVRRLGLAERVRFTGALPQAEAAARMRAAALLIGASREEPLGLVFLEGLASGCGVVATRVGGIPEVLSHEEDALLVPPDDPAALAAAIDRFHEDPALRVRLAAAAPRTAARHGMDASVEHTLSVYRQLRG